MKNPICLLAILCLSSLMGCNSPLGPSKAEVSLTQACIEMTNATQKGRDPASVKSQCECSAKVAAPKCGAPCENPDGTGAFILSLTKATADEIDKKCPATK